MKKIIILLSVFAASFSAVSCDNYLDIEPEGKIIPKTVDDYRKVITTAYSKYPQHKSLTALRTDELLLDEYSSDFMSYREVVMWKDTNQDQATTPFQWEAFYSVIFYANQIINEGQETMEASPEKDQIIAEAYALRAYAYFDLVNLYGKPYQASTAASDRGVPINLSLDLEKTLPASSVAEVYAQVHSDLEKSAALMNLDTQADNVRYRFSKSALAAFNARVSLYEQNWDEALKNAETALSINNSLVNLNNESTVPNHYTSPEAILSLDNTFIGALKFSTTASSELIASYDQVNDLRFKLYFEKSGADYKVIKVGDAQFRVSFRVSELYFIKAEALLKSNRLGESKSTLNEVLKNRYTVTGFANVQANVASMNATQLMAFILEERNREFALEGQRWFDLRRANQKQIIHSIGGTDYILQQNDVRYTIEIPQQAKLNNPNL